MMRRILHALAISAALAALAGGQPALAQVPCNTVQSTPAFSAGGNVFGRIAAQWNAYFAAKVDANNGTLCNPTIVGTLNLTYNEVVSALAFTPLNRTNNLSDLASAPTARGAAALNIDSVRNNIGDNSATLLATDRVVITSVAFTAPRTWTLPAASSVNPGQSIVVGDAVSAISSSNTLSIAPAGADKINNSASAITLVNPGALLVLYSDGVSNWATRRAVNATTVNVSNQYQVNGSQIAAANLSDGNTGTGNIVHKTGPTIQQPLIAGVTDGSTAAAGNVGEVLSCNATGVSLVTGVSKDICTVSLTAGDWFCNGTASFNPAGTTTVSTVLVGGSTTANTLPTDPDESFAGLNATLTTGARQRITSGPKEFSSSGAQTVRIVAQAGFGTSTMTVDGKYVCRRTR